jgi:thioredoxin-like negative regulator of GroEL
LYRKVLEVKPEYTAARLALARLVAKTGDAEGALRELQAASASDPRNSAILEQTGDVEALRGRAAKLGPRIGPHCIWRPTGPRTSESTGS